MARPKFVQLPSRTIERFRPLLGEDYARTEAAAERARGQFEGRAIWHISSTVRGGGVAEILHSLLPYVRGAGIDTRWVVLRERPDFFALTKRLHNDLHCRRTGAQRARRLGAAALRGRPCRERPPPDAAAARRRPRLPARSADRRSGRDGQGRGDDRDLALPHRRRPPRRDRQGGLALPPPLRARAPTRYVFSRPEYVWDGLDRDRVRIMAPSIDPFAPKNQDLEPATVTAILRAIGISDGAPPATPSFTRADGTPGRVERQGEVVQEEFLPGDATAIVQISRWDRLKDHRRFARVLRDPSRRQRPAARPRRPRERRRRRRSGRRRRLGGDRGGAGRTWPSRCGGGSTWSACRCSTSTKTPRW